MKKENGVVRGIIEKYCKNMSTKTMNPLIYKRSVMDCTGYDDSHKVCPPYVCCICKTGFMRFKFKNIDIETGDIRIFITCPKYYYCRSILHVFCLECFNSTMNQNLINWKDKYVSISTIPCHQCKENTIGCADDIGFEDC